MKKFPYITAMKKNIILLYATTMLIYGAFNLSSTPTKTYQYTTVTCAVAPAISGQDWYKTNTEAPLFEGLDVLEFPVSTRNPMAQRYFNQGLVLAYAFNHAEAARSFYYASQLDPGCAMTYWGFAYVLGPNYNSAMESDHYELAYNAIQTAKNLSSVHCTPKEKDLIDALAVRYVKEPVEDRSHLDMAYSDAMKSVFKSYTKDADIGTLYAESLMILHPWDLWNKKGNPRSWTPEIILTLEQVLNHHPRHPGAHHYYIHAVEASNEPEKGLNSAQLYDEGLVPAAGHLLHMPSHIYIRTGKYHEGSLANFRAIEADSLYITACKAQGLYPLAYFPHNYHFLTATATLEGNSRWAIDAAIKVAENADKKMMTEPGWGTLQHYYTIPFYVYVKFAKWNEILQMKNEDPSMAYPEAVRSYARGMAFLGTGKTNLAKEELTALRKLADDPSIREITIWDLNNATDLLEIAVHVLEAEILASENNFGKSISLLQKAVQLEDNLNYNEPPDWFFSVRHHLGTVQIEAGRYADALATFEDDLLKFPENGWALHGMKLAYSRQNDHTNEKKIDERLETVWATADVDLSGARIKGNY
jgi:tetratricopeptide (TPR) repeat protein